MDIHRLMQVQPSANVQDDRGRRWSDAQQQAVSDYWSHIADQSNAYAGVLNGLDFTPLNTTAAAIANQRAGLPRDNYSGLVGNGANTQQSNNPSDQRYLEILSALSNPKAGLAQAIRQAGSNGSR